MGAVIDVTVFVVGGADAVGSLHSGNGPIGVGGQVISTAGAGGQAIGSIIGAGQAGALITNNIGLLGSALSAVQLTIDLQSGQSIKIGDTLSIGVGIPVGIAVATGAIAGGSVLISIGAIASLASAAFNIGGFTLDDIFKILYRPGEDELNEKEKSNIEKLIKEIMPISTEIGNEISRFTPLRDFEEICRNPNSPTATSPTYRIVYIDPLAIDLDGDGLETVGIGGASTVVFDHDGDGLKTGTGWLKGEDAWLVRDLNGNGRIDSGAEMFGDQTLLPNGHKASTGLQALAALDSNLDGRIDASDTAFGELRIWQDRNGITDCTTRIEIPDALKNLPNLKGMGRLRDLREAAALSQRCGRRRRAVAVGDPRRDCRRDANHTRMTYGFKTDGAGFENQRIGTSAPLP